MVKFWKNKKVLVCGGAGFIGSHIVERLVRRKANVLVLDDFSTGSPENLKRVWNKIAVIVIDLSNPYIPDTLKYFKKADVIIHLAAIIGGRGYINEHPADCFGNLGINHNVIKLSHLAKVDRIHYSSTACVYPRYLQEEYGSTYLLVEHDAFRSNMANCDLAYGWSKFMGELELQAYRDQYGMKGSIARYVTAFGPRESESHAIIALLKRAMNKEDPYLVWGTGNADRDFTYVSDIVDSTLLQTELITDCTPINVGTGIRYTIKETIKKIFDVVNWEPNEIFYDTSKPEGVRSRALDISKAKKLLKWRPKVSLERGLERTYKWLLKQEKKK